MAATTKKENWTTHEGACASCRTRKIRCGREKPQCNSCSRDGIDCVYSSPPKRVNQVKVLSQNFDDISERLALMQGELSSLTAMFRRSDIAEKFRLDLSDQDIPTRDTSGTNSGTSTPPLSGPGHFVRDDQTLVERYHGPCTLVALCRNFGADLTSYMGGSDEVVGSLVNRMLLDISTNDHMDFELGSGHDDTVCPPPRQFLSVMLETFLKQADYNTDIFCHQTIYEAVERVYREPSSPASEPWALCFNLIILLALGIEHPVRGDDPFVRPMLQAAHVAARKPSFFMSPRLVNVQALALLSLLAQQYHEETFGDSIFAQACTLAKAIGLHQTGYGISPELSEQEAEERSKVFRSLYIRDRFSATAHGSQSWLLNPAASLTNTQGSPAWELTRVQDELERLFAAEAAEMSASQRENAFARAQEKLNKWSQSHHIPSTTRPAPRDVPHYLAFLGTRMRALGSHSVTDNAQVLYDARLSCLLVATSSNPTLNEALSDELDRLLMNPIIPARGSSRIQASFTPSHSRNVSSISAATSSIIDGPHKSGLLTPNSQTSSQSAMPIHRLASVFPTAAIFTLARHILGIPATNSEQPQQQQKQSQQQQNRDTDSYQHERNEDISLLETLLFCFRSASLIPMTSTPASSTSATYAFKLARILQHLIAIIHAQSDPMSSSTFLSDPHMLDVLPDALSLPNLHMFSNSSDTSSQISPPFYPGLSLSSSTTAGSSDTSLAMTPISGPQIPDTPFDISQFLNQMGGMGSPGSMWSTPDMGMQQQQFVQDSGNGRGRVWGKNKRARTESESDCEREKSVGLGFD